MLPDSSALLGHPAACCMPLAPCLPFGAVLGFVFLQPMAHHRGAALCATGCRSAAAAVIVCVQLDNRHNLVAVLAGDVPVHTTLLGQSVAACDALGALGVGAADQGELAAALVVPLDVLTRAFVVASRARALDFEAVQLVFDDQRQSAVVSRLVDRLTVNRTCRLHFEGPVNTSCTKCMAAGGRYRGVERCSADRAEQSVVDGPDVL